LNRQAIATGVASPADRGRWPSTHSRVLIESIAAAGLAYVASAAFEAPCLPQSASAMSSPRRHGASTAFRPLGSTEESGIGAQESESEIRMREYDLIADWYRSDRSRSIGVQEALAAVASLPRGSRILDLGCGNGWPITDALIAAGYRVVGLDSSQRMLEQFRVNVPDTPAVRGDARACPFAADVFDAAISWGMLFHLERRDQSAAFASASRLLKPGAPFLFTAAEIPDIPADDPGITGTMNGVTFRYYAVADYRTLIAEHGFDLVDVYDDPGVSTYYLARKAN
jgi:ubiquinone/menaquinone biosynthesis C-methylase UbiE